MVTAKRASALLIAALVPLLSIVLFAGGKAQKAAGAAETRASTAATPSATEFAAEFIGVTNQYAKEHGDTGRAGHAHCVQAAPGRYMCAYRVTRNGTSMTRNGTWTCHLMQARWTPDQASTITVTLAGRTGTCTTLKEAIRSLG
jgi:hypothetical protein